MVLPAPPREPHWRANPTGLLAMLLVVAVVVGTWWLSGGDPGTPTATPTPTPGASSPSSTTPGSATARVPGGPVSGEVDPTTGLRWVALDELPPEAGETLDLIRSGGPFPYGQDGARFENREGILPDRPSGSYAEYTVETPGSPDRGARRIVTGDPDELFWTEDHYDSFERIIG